MKETLDQFKRSPEGFLGSFSDAALDGRLAKKLVRLESVATRKPYTSRSK
jgi:hypothetical protein